MSRQDYLEEHVREDHAMQGLAIRDLILDP